MQRSAREERAKKEQSMGKKDVARWVDGIVIFGEELTWFADMRMTRI